MSGEGSSRSGAGIARAGEGPVPGRYRQWKRPAGLLVTALMAAITLAARHGTGTPGLLDESLPAGAPPRNLPGLANVVRLSARLYTGGVPEGDAGFATLARLGIRSIISVDGMPPDLERARRYGMRYVHLPFGYDGCPRPTANRIVRAVRDLPGPVYVHCHHGRHRSPAAGALVRIALDGIPAAQAVQEMERAGTDHRYRGLYASVRAYTRPTPDELNRTPADFPEVAPLPPLVTAMVQIDQHFSRLMDAQRHHWQPPTGKPPFDPAHEALLLRELFREAMRTSGATQRPADFRRWLAESERQGKALEVALRAGEQRRANAALRRIAIACASCHAKYRDVPAVVGRDRE